MSCTDEHYTLPTRNFVGGSSEEFQFNLYHDVENQEPCNIFGGEANFSIVSFINRLGTPIVSKKMEVHMNDEGTYYNVIRVCLDPSDTVELFGKFIYQITLKDIEGNIDIPHQGIINIYNNIDKLFTKRE